MTAALLGACSLVLAADDEIPEVEFLEYLGLWEESDEDWLLFEGEELTAETDENVDTLPRLKVPQGDVATETDDES
ncbi:MAG: hypothetical protein ACE5F8_00940 [Woeseiaceae bacterium]